MASLAHKFLNTLSERGLFVTLLKCQSYMVRLWLYKQSPEYIFSSYYYNNSWENEESVSGSGSTLAYTVLLRSKLPELFSIFGIKTIFDAPCGDFNWMRHVLEKLQVSYVGGDIVPDLISSNTQKYAKPNIQFCVVNITRDKFPKADLWICRDCLFHLSYKDIYFALKNFIASDVPYILTTSHINNSNSPFQNCNIKTGDYRRIDLFSSPFYFPEKSLFRITDYVPSASATPKEMCLWTREQIGHVLPEMELRLRQYLK